MDPMASQITSHTIVYSTIYPGANQRKHQSSASLVSVRAIHRNSPHKWPVTRKMFPLDDVSMGDVLDDCKFWHMLKCTIYSVDGWVSWPLGSVITRRVPPNIYNKHYAISEFPIRSMIYLCNSHSAWNYHYCDVIMGAMAYQITSLTIVYLIVHPGAGQRKHQSPASLAFVRGIHRWAVNSPYKWSVTRKIFPFDDVITSC